ncbi:MAG: DJ-1/PfpI family protein [Mucilaginibacter sp.]
MLNSNSTDHELNVAILIYDGVELVDMNGPLDAFLHANRYNGNRYNVYTVSATMDAIISEGNVVTIVPKYDITNCPNPDIIVIPGIINKQVNETIITWLTAMCENPERIIMSVCIGFFTLAQTGILSGKKATTHYLSISDAHNKYPDVIFEKNVRYVADGNIITTGGITSGIDGALYLIERLDNTIIAQQTADVMVYNREAPLPPFTILPPYFSI